MTRARIYVWTFIITAMLVISITGCGVETDSSSINQADTTEKETSTEATIETTNEVPESVDDFVIPDYSGKPSIPVNNNQPQFDDSMKTTESFEEYGALDKHGRCTAAFANLSIDTQPGSNEERGDISSVHPSGWKSEQGWERCHLIGWQLSGENDNARNLITGTHYMNVDGMLPFENEVATYIEETGNHVLYKVDPVFEGKNMVCAGVHMQAESVEDDGEGVSYNVFCFNVSPGYEINYKTGDVTVTDEEVAAENGFERTYVLNKNTMKFHYPSCSSVADMAEHNKETVTTSRDELIKQGYEPCGNCEP